MNASTTCGSNCVPAQRRSSSIASASLFPRSYGRSEVIASNESHTNTMRLASGISSPRDPAGSPRRPSARGWRHDLRDPDECWRGAQYVRADRRMAAHHLPLLLVQWSRLVQHRERDRDLADVVQLGRVYRIGQSPDPPGPSDEPRLRPASRRARSACAAPALRRQDLQRQIPRLLAGAGTARILLCVHPLVDQLHRQIGIVGLLGQHHRSVGARYREALTLLAQRAQAGFDHLLAAIAPEQGAELVSPRR